MSRRRKKASAFGIYLSETRSVGWSLAMVVPLLLAYEVAALALDAPLRNGAEMVVAHLVHRLPAHSLDALRHGIFGLVVAGTLWWVRRSPPSVARAHWMLLEALGLAVLLGPLVSWMVGGLRLSVAAPLSDSPAPPWLPFLLSIGAGLWEEIVFRLVLLGGLAFLLRRLTGFADAGVLAIAVVVSALAFALYHHAGDFGEPLELSRFAFRFVAGTILGVLFALRGFAVVVYMHVFYDVLCDLRAMS